MAADYYFGVLLLEGCKLPRRYALLHLINSTLYLADRRLKRRPDSRASLSIASTLCEAGLILSLEEHRVLILTLVIKCRELRFTRLSSLLRLRLLLVLAGYLRRVTIVLLQHLSVLHLLLCLKDHQAIGSGRCRCLMIACGAADAAFTYTATAFAARTARAAARISLFWDWRLWKIEVIVFVGNGILAQATEYFEVFFSEPTNFALMLTYNVMGLPDHFVNALNLMHAEIAEELLGGRVVATR